ncbi:MAG TPA: 2,3-bisphosphoglycerate-independent phosphoglycerate mutase, partial [Candidatus Pacearchaeota archaeon]|nr:2,3-bisphosphoglycerate-independent phosphoglycerate mutase [Candidatus Pacearchaeota archaeon]
MKAKRPVILIIRDGWGYCEDKENNLIAAAKTPFNDFLMEKYPFALLKADGEAVGLEPGYQGNSEVGHLTIGSGRIIYQPLSRIQNSIRNGSFFSIPEFLEIIEYCRKNSSTLHLLGLLQKEGVHSHLDHLFALLDLCKKKNFQNVVIHAITDGRDAPVQKGIDYLRELEDKLSNLGFGIIATLSGRYYAMDRDYRWERTKSYYDCLVSGIGTRITDIPPSSALNACYQKGETDEFIKPLVFSEYSGVKNSDGIIFFNFRTDRTRQITKALIEKDFDAWDRPLANIRLVAMTQYYTPMNAAVAFADQKINNMLGE